MKKLPVQFGLRGIFSIIVVAEIVLAVGLAWLATYLCDVILDRPVTIAFPSTGWIFIISIFVTSGISIFVNRKLLEPIRRLSRAMSRVAGGEYQVELTEKSLIHEIDESYANFNLMTRELRATEVLQTDFISNVSHELKTPINAIQGYAMLLEDEDCSVQERVEYTQKLLVNTRRLSDLVSNMLLLSRIENAAIDTGIVYYRLDEQIRQSILDLQELWVAQEIDWDVRLEEVILHGNQALLYHVWMNLIANAVKFSPKGGKITLKLEKIGGFIRFVIQDEGPGISEQDRIHIFERFYQGDTSRRDQGHGLGLALVKRILDFTGGCVRLADMENGGACFVVEFREK